MNSLSSERSFTVGVLVSNPQQHERITANLEQVNGITLFFASESDVLEARRTQRIHALILSADNLAFCGAIRRGERDLHFPILTLVNNLEEADLALGEDSSDVFMLPISNGLLGRRLRHLVDAYFQVQQVNTLQGRFDALYQNVPIMMHALDRNGIVLRVNQRWLEIMGYQAEDIEGKPYKNILPAERRETVDAAIKKFFDDGIIRDFKTRLRCADGQYRDFLIDANVFQAEDGEIASVTVLRDITDMQRSETNLKESNRLYRNLFEGSTDAILLMEMDTGTIVEANDSASLMLGYTLDELRKLKFQDIDALNVEVKDITEQINLKTLNPMLMEQQYRRKNGSLVPVESNSRVIRFQDRAAVLYIARDITNRKQVLSKEKELRLLAETLRESAAEFNTSLSLNGVLDIAIKMVRRVVPAPVANVMRILDGKLRVVRWTGYEAFGFSNFVMGNMALDTLHLDHVQRMIETSLPVYLPNTWEAGWPKFNEATSGWIRSFLGAPIIVKGELFGFLNVDSPTVNAFTEEHIDSMNALANQMAIAVGNAQLVDQLQTAKNALETTVTERTEALIRANMSLRRSVSELTRTEESLERERVLLKMIIDSIGDMIYVKDREGRYILVNEASIRAMGGNVMEDITGGIIFNFFSSDYSKMHHEIDMNIITTGESVVNMDNSITYADGTVHRQLLSKQPLHDKSGTVIGIVGINRDITEMSIIQKNLEEEREQLAQVLRSARCLLWTATLTSKNEDYEWDFQIINEDAAQALLPLDLNGRAYRDVWRESIVLEDAERRRLVLGTHLQFGREGFSHEMRCTQQDSTVIWLAEDVQIKKLNIMQWRLVGICTDITKRKQAEANLQAAYDDLEMRIQLRMAELLNVNTALRVEITERQRAEESERQQRLLAEALTQSLATLNSSFDRDALFDYLLDTIEDVVPHRAANIMLVDQTLMIGTLIRWRGYPAGDRVGSLVHDISKYPDKQYILQHNSHYIINETRTAYEWQNMAGLEWIRSTLAVPIRLDEGVIGFLNVESEIPNNFTVQHAEWLTAFANQAALALRNARLVEQIRTYAADLEKIVQSRTAQLRAVLESIRDGLIYHNLDEEPQYLNRALVDMLGYSTEDWMQRHPNYADLIEATPDLKERMLLRWTRQLEINGYMQDDVTLKRRDGTTFPAMIMRVLVKDEEGESIGTLMLARDISQAKQLEEQRERFIANASHELRTPIANMKTRLYLMRRKPESITENLEIIVNVTNWMQRLVDDMFDLSRFQRGILELHREQADVRELLREIMVFQQLEAERKEIVLGMNAPTEPIIASIDPYRLMQVFSNLVSNAINYTPLGGQVGVEVSVEPSKQGQDLLITVADTGQGIPAEHLDNLFKPFFRASGQSRGAGLGLSIAREIIGLHGGTIGVESSVGVGSRFTIRIPIVLDETPTPASVN